MRIGEWDIFYFLLTGELGYCTGYCCCYLALFLYVFCILEDPWV